MDAVAEIRRGPRQMDVDERDRFLAGRSWGVLSTVGADGTPYGVPVAYGWDGRSFWVATGPGRKLKNLEANGAACLTIGDVEAGSRWRCVVASGTAVPVSGLEAARGLGHVARQQGNAPSAGDLARALRSRVFRLAPAELSGRARD
jgi:nitroimidazol reductase NimA-like FMN-containing flavoprotein (pyridoxamine 5'-phosphate oxidase superfamily)